MGEDLCSRAMDKIRDEMAKTKDDGVLEIGEAMTTLLLIAPETSEQIMAEGKNCAGAYKALKRYAQPNGKECVPPRKAAELVAEYWELPPEVEQELARLRAAAGQSEEAGMVRKLMEDLSSICQRLGYQLTAAAAKDPEAGEKLRRAAAKALHKQAEALEG